MRIKPVRVARGQKQLACAISFGQFGFRSLKMLRQRRGTERIFLAGTADGRCHGLIAFKQNGRNFNFFAAGAGTTTGCGFQPWR